MYSICGCSSCDKTILAINFDSKILHWVEVKNNLPPIIKQWTV